MQLNINTFKFYLITIIIGILLNICELKYIMINNVKNLIGAKWI